MQKVKVYKCPHCEAKYKSLAGWNKHIEDVHPETIPEGWTTSQYFYYILTGKTSGKCPICKGQTPWNEKALKYARMCGSEECKRKNAEIANARNLAVYGKEKLLGDPEVQKKMLKNRKISGEYEFSDHGVVSYVGSYEKDFLMVMDTTLDWISADIIAPSPNVYKYIYDGKEHFYIPDFYIPSLNLEIEIKTQQNMHHKIQAVDKVKESEKDKVMEALSSVHYIKINDKEYDEFFKLINELKEMKE